MRRQDMQMIKASQLLLAVSIIMTALQCRDLGVDENTHARITVFVHWGETAIPEKKVELMQTGESMSTDDRDPAVFVVKPANYLIQVYGINRGGQLSSLSISV